MAMHGRKLQVSWREVTTHAGAPKARSSHAVSVVGHNAYVFGGEFEPRVPIDNKVYVFNLKTRIWSIAETTGDVPLPRIGVSMAAVDGIIYVFGGRDKEHEELNEFYSFDTETREWKLLTSGEKSPPHRSYHALAADLEKKVVYTFGGCGRNGRLNDLWMFDICLGDWTALALPPPSSSLVPRGGPGLAVVHGTVWVIFGFCGEELTDIHRFDPRTSVWQEISASGDQPTGRSVFGTFVIDKQIIIYGGEVDPSEEGHMGAGAFSNEIFVLDAECLVWTKLEGELKEGNAPGARGWYAAASYDNSMLVYGGNSSSNDRLEDMYVLSLG